ncbi:MAG TPA: MarR family winged helix-turn-helix transcriptional regulator [Roseiarcus sp.]|nr:MarR family winged helix-turn-helix transcriptional regulator [Roseiarcus sp.]
MTDETLTEDEAAPRAAGGQEIDLTKLTDLIGYQLRRAQIAVFDDFIRSFAPYDIRPTQYGVLTAIEGNPGSSQAAIAQSLGIKRSNFVKLIDEFERRKLVVRKAVAGDRRANALFLTKTGQSELAELHKVRIAHEARIAAAIGDESDRRALLGQLARLTMLKG